MGDSRFKKAIDDARWQLSRERVLCATPQGGGSVVEYTASPRTVEGSIGIYFTVSEYDSIREDSEFKKILSLLSPGDARKIAYGILSALADAESANEALSVNDFRKFKTP
jgi:hypothetical protein